GWVKPIVLIPAAALGGLSSEELEMIIVHELAHIKRHDILINYLQTVLETLFFFNPAVWYISRLIRIEREHCCDDAAVTITGDKMKYVKALANLEELRVGASHLTPAATTGSLLERIRRIVLPPAVDRGTGSAMVSVISIFLLAATLFVLQGLAPDRVTADIYPAKIDQFESRRSDLKGDWELIRGDRKQQIRIEFRRGLFGGQMSMTQYFDKLDLTPGESVLFKWERDAGTFFFEGSVDEFDGFFEGEGDCYFRARENYVDRMKAMNYEVDEKDCLTLAVHDITLEFAKEIRELGYDIDLDRLVEFHLHDVNPEYIRELRDLGYNELHPDKLMEMCIHNVTPDYIRELSKFGVSDLNPSELVAMKIHGVEPDYIAQFQQLGYDKIDSDKLVEMRIHGVSPEFVSDLKEYGYDNLSTSKLVEMQIHNVDIYFIRGLVKLGYKDLSPSKLVEMKIHNVTPYYVKQLTEVGYTKIDPSDLVSMRIHGVDASFIRKLQKRGYDDLTPEELVDRKIHGDYRSRQSDDESY
ncbi:MAG: M56 family metallopeptidase, partial [Candidatus Zixiibacteriota bacterium]